jgi:hypothetical protein
MYISIHNSKYISRQSEFGVKLLGSPNISHVCATHSSYFRSRKVIFACNAHVCSHVYTYPIITKLILVFRSRPGNLSFDLDYKAGYNHNETSHIIK